MATLVYNNIEKCFELYHGDKDETFLLYKFREYLGKIKIPKFSEYNEQNKDEFVKVSDFYDKIIQNENSFLYPMHNMEVKVISQLNDIEYIPVKIPIYTNSTNNFKYPSLDNVLDFFEISFSEYTNLLSLVQEKGYNRIIVKNSIKLYVSPYMYSYFTIFKGKPKTKYFEVEWKNRYNSELPIKNIPNYYKKKIRSKYVGGTEGELFVTLFYGEVWKNLFEFEPNKIDFTSYQIPEITDYDMPCSYSEEQLKFKKEKEERERKRKEEYEQQRMMNRHKAGYCDYCGAEHATYRADPYQMEIHGEIVMGWFCDRCYQSFAEDI